MDFSALPEDFFVHLGKITKTVYRDQYPSIDPTSAALSQRGKVVVITGASQGLGREAFATAFAKAHAKALVLIARNAENLKETARIIHEINPAVEIMTQALDVRDEDAVKALFARIKDEFGSVDVLVNNAGVGTSVMRVVDIGVDDFWCDFETNVKGTLLMTQNFLKLVGDSKPATIINITSTAGTMVMPTTSSYSLSKLVQLQLQRFIAAENPNITATSLQPGTILTTITKPAFERFSKDTHALAGGAAVWLATEQARFMNGRYMNANWSVDEIVAMGEGIVERGELVMELRKTEVKVDA